jgi:hypothetical protein
MKITLSNAGLVGKQDESFTEFATRAAAEHERRGALDDAQKWRDARWREWNKK